jgi:predicted ArsR family transcriptional regulator
MVAAPDELAAQRGEIAMLGGWVQRAVCWVLLEEGQLTAAAICAQIDGGRDSVCRALRDMRKLGLVQSTQDSVDEGRGLLQFGLTRKGAEGAMHLTAEEMTPYLRSK